MSDQTHVQATLLPDHVPTQVRFAFTLHWNCAVNQTRHLLRVALRSVPHYTSWSTWLLSHYHFLMWSLLWFKLNHQWKNLKWTWPDVDSVCLSIYFLCCFFSWFFVQNGKDLVQEVTQLRRSLDDAEGLSLETKKEWAFLRSENISLKERDVSQISFQKMYYSPQVIVINTIFPSTGDFDCSVQPNGERGQVPAEPTRAWEIPFQENAGWPPERAARGFRWEHQAHCSSGWKSS